jgi:hypothetical protein
MQGAYWYMDAYINTEPVPVRALYLCRPCGIIRFLHEVVLLYCIIIHNIRPRGYSTTVLCIIQVLIPTSQFVVRVLFGLGLRLTVKYCTVL